MRDTVVKHTTSAFLRKAKAGCKFFLVACLFMLLGYQSSHGQNAEKIKYWQRISDKAINDDTLKVKALTFLSDEYFFDLEKRYEILYDAKELALSKLDNKDMFEWWARAAYKLGYCHQYAGKIDSAKFYYEVALDYALKADKPKEKTNAYTGLGQIAAIEKRFSQAIRYFSKSMYIDKLINFERGIMYDHQDLAGIYELINEDNRAINSYEEYYSWAKKLNDTLSLVQAPLAIARIYASQKKYERAESYLEEAYDHALEANSPIHTGVVLMNMVELFLEQWNMLKAAQFYVKLKPILPALRKRPEYRAELAYIDITFALAEGKQNIVEQRVDEFITQYKKGNINIEELPVSRVFQAFNEGKLYSLIEKAFLTIRDQLKAYPEEYKKANRIFTDALVAQGRFKDADKYYLLGAVIEDTINRVYMSEFATSLDAGVGLAYSEKELLVREKLIASQKAIKKYTNWGIGLGVGVLIIIGTVLATGLATQQENGKRIERQNERIKQRTQQVLAQRDKLALTNQEVEDKNRLLEKERARTNELLENILPPTVAKELYQTGVSEARNIREASVLFTDFEGFTSLASKTDPEDLIDLLDSYFKKFDEISTKWGLEKIKTIGDAYVLAAGVPEPMVDHANRICKAALEMLAYTLDFKNNSQALGSKNFNIRIGVHSGPLVGGLVGEATFTYDIYGNTVNLAAKLESKAPSNAILISEVTASLLSKSASIEAAGVVTSKTGQQLNTFILKSLT